MVGHNDQWFVHSTLISRTSVLAMANLGNWNIGDLLWVAPVQQKVKLQGKGEWDGECFELKGRHSSPEIHFRLGATKILNW